MIALHNAMHELSTMLSKEIYAKVLLILCCRVCLLDEKKKTTLQHHLSMVTQPFGGCSHGPGCRSLLYEYSIERARK